MPRCPTCARPAALRATNAAFPFCSPRCRLVDLGKWLNEEYRVPVTESPDSPDDEGREPGSPSGHPTSQEQE
jgi:endogenous inhibitor of DNA gyrase (YacG/DUF329 family)